MKHSFIEFKDVVKKYGKGEGEQIAVDQLNFAIDEGEFVVILGPSGAGKSTVMNILGGMDQTSSGSIWVNEQEISAMKDKELSVFRAEKVGFIFQFYNLLPSLTAKENIKLTKSIVKNAADPLTMLSDVGLEKHADKYPSQMSGGEQQRVSIARALAKRPKLILGDEPTGALDSETGIKVLELIHDVCKKNNTTTIIVTHNADIAQCADRVIRMKNGKIKDVSVNDCPKKICEVVW